MQGRQASAYVRAGIGLDELYHDEQLIQGLVHDLEGYEDNPYNEAVQVLPQQRDTKKRGFIRIGIEAAGLFKGKLLPDTELVVSFDADIHNDGINPVAGVGLVYRPGGN